MMVRETVLDVLWKLGVFGIRDFEKGSTAWTWVFPTGKSCIPFRSCLACLLVFSAFVVVLCRRFLHSRSLGRIASVHVSRTFDSPSRNLNTYCTF